MLTGSSLSALLVGCAGISSQARSQVTYHGGFAELQARPEAYLGQVVLLGGRILEAQPGAERSVLNVLQLALDAQDEPVEDDRSQGRFRVTAPRLLDPEVFRQGLRITVVGRVSGSQSAIIGTLAYRMPVLEVIELKLWPPQQRFDPYPRFHFGFGVGTHL